MNYSINDIKGNKAVKKAAEVKLEGIQIEALAMMFNQYMKDINKEKAAVTRQTNKGNDVQESTLL